MCEPMSDAKLAEIEEIGDLFVCETELVAEVRRLKDENAELKKKSEALSDGLHLLHMADEECECKWCEWASHYEEDGDDRADLHRH